MDYEQYIVERDDNGIYRKCPFCGAKIWDGPHSEHASGFVVHITQKISGHSEKADWKLKFEKESWSLGTS
jgi:hypothetical protein